MLAIKQYRTSNIIPLSIPAEPRPGEHIRYTHGGRILSGHVWGSMTVQLQRFVIDGKHPVIVEYIVEPDPGQTNLSYHTVHESEIIWKAKS